jgi:hypothetical protein
MNSVWKTALALLDRQEVELCIEKTTEKPETLRIIKWNGDGAPHDLVTAYMRLREIVKAAKGVADKKPGAFGKLRNALRAIDMEG